MVKVMILSSQNKKWGYWGVASLFIKKRKIETLWQQVNLLVQEVGGFTPEQSRILLDSRFGFLIALALKNELNKASFEVVFRKKYSKDILKNAYQYYVGIWGE